MGRVDVYLPEEVEKALRKWAYENDKSLSKAIRRLIEDHIIGYRVDDSAEPPQRAPRNPELTKQERELDQRHMYPPRKAPAGRFQQWKGQECVFGPNQCKKYGKAHTHLQSECDEEERMQKVTEAWKEKNHSDNEV